MTADSAREQMSAGLDRLSEEEFVAFHRLNEAYRAKFNMPFVVCVRRHGKEIDPSVVRTAPAPRCGDGAGGGGGEIIRIAALRLDQRVSAPDRLKVHGQLSTHVLDTHRGRPAEGVEIEFLEAFASGKSRCCRARRPMPRAGPTGRSLPMRLFRSRNTNCGLRSATILRGWARRPPIRLSSASCPSASPSPSPRRTITYRSWLRPGATPRTAEADGRGLDRDALGSPSCRGFRSTNNHGRAPPARP